MVYDAEKFCANCSTVHGGWEHKGSLAGENEVEIEGSLLSSTSRYIHSASH